MRIDFNPYQGIGDIRIGMTRHEIRSIFPGRFRDISDKEGSMLHDALEDDIYGSLQINYDLEPPHFCNGMAVVTFPSSVFFLGKQISDVDTLKDLTIWLKGLDEEIDITIDGVVSYKYGIILYTGDLRTEFDWPLECLGIFPKGVHNFAAARDFCDHIFTWEEFLALESED